MEQKQNILMWYNYRLMEGSSEKVKKQFFKDKNDVILKFKF